MSRSLRRLILAAALSLGMTAARAEIPPAAAELILRTNQPAVVTIEGTLKMSVRTSGAAVQQQFDIPVECPGTVLDPSGLVAASSLLLDPIGSLVKGPIRMEQQGQTIEIQFISRLEALHFLLPDKTEVPAKIVTQDDDLHLTLLAPDAASGRPPAAMPAIQLERTMLPAPFESFILVGRTGVNFQREPFLHSGVLCALLDKPRALFIPQVQDVPQFMGLPFFAADGCFIGLGSVHYRAPRAEGLPPSLQNLNVIPVIIPAADIRDWVARARKTAPPEAAVKK